jgi:hypothetical protein
MCKIVVTTFDVVTDMLNMSKDISVVLCGSEI